LNTDDQAAQIFLAFSRTQAIVHIWGTTLPQETTAARALLHFHQVFRQLFRNTDMVSWITETLTYTTITEISLAVSRATSERSGYRLISSIPGRRERATSPISLSKSNRQQIGCIILEYPKSIAANTRISKRKLGDHVKDTLRRYGYALTWLIIRLEYQYKR